jgi:hypothetical protein
MIEVVPTIEPGSSPYYILAILYDQLGFSVRYIGPATYGESLIRVCYIFNQVTDIDLWLQSPKQVTPLVQGAITPDEMPYFRSLEEATGMSLEKFYNTF